MKTLISTIACCVALVSTNVEAADMKRISFESNGQTLIGNLYLPESYQEGQKIAGVVVTGSWTSVKEQMAGLYAAELADRGFAALAFDFRGWGESKIRLCIWKTPNAKLRT